MSKPKYIAVEDIKTDEEKSILILAEILYRATDAFIDTLEEKGFTEAKDVGSIVFNGIANYLHAEFTMIFKNIKYEFRQNYIDLFKSQICHVLDQVMIGVNSH